MFPTAKLYTFEVACRLFMSLEDEEKISKLAILYNIFLKGLISIPFNFPGTRFHKAMKATSAIKNLLGKIVKQRRVALEQKTAVPSQDLLSHLLVTPDENGKFMSEPVIVNNILMLLFAGHETSSVSITMLMKNLAHLPHVYEKVLAGKYNCIYNIIIINVQAIIINVGLIHQSRMKLHQEKRKGSFCNGRIYRR